MKVIIFGASGMVGQGVLRECLRDPRVEKIVAVGRRPLGIPPQSKLQEIVCEEMTKLSPFEDQLRGFGASFFCLGVSSFGKSEAEYRRLTYDLTVTVAQVLARLNPAMTFIYVSGAGTDSTEHGRVMWARVKGETENALRRLPFKAAYMFRPGIIQPLHGIKSKTTLYRLLYQISGPMIWLMKKMSDGWVTTTEQVGRAMITVAAKGAPKPLLENKDINRL